MNTSSAHDKSPYFSSCGGLWIDRYDWAERLDHKRASGEITPQEAEDLRFYIGQGYLIFPQAVPRSRPTLIVHTSIEYGSILRRMSG